MGKMSVRECQRPRTIRDLRSVCALVVFLVLVAGDDWCESHSAATVDTVCKHHGADSQICHAITENQAAACESRSTATSGGKLSTRNLSGAKSERLGEAMMSGRRRWRNRSPTFFGRRRRSSSRRRCNRAKCNDPNCDAETMLKCPTLHKSVWWGNAQGAMNARFGYKEGQKDIDCTLQRFLDAKSPAQAVVPIVAHSMWGPKVSADSKGLNVKVAHTTCTAFDNTYLLEAKAVCNPSYGGYYTIKDRPVYMCSRAGVIAPLNQYRLQNQCCETKDYNHVDGSCRRPSNMKGMHSTHCRNAVVIAKYNLCVTKTGKNGKRIKECFEYKYAKCYQCRNYIKLIEGGQGFTQGVTGRIDFVQNCKDPKPCGTGMTDADRKILLQNAADQVAGF